MYAELHDIIDEAAIAFDTEGISERQIRDAILDGLRKLADDKLGMYHTLSCVLDEETDMELAKSLAEYNKWSGPNTPAEDDEWPATTTRD